MSNKRYNKDKMIEQSIKAIKEHQLIYISEIFAYVPFSKQTFYTYKLDKIDDIIKTIEQVRIEIKQSLRKQWRESKSPYLQQLLYRLCANEDELMRIRQTEAQAATDNSNIEQKLEEIGKQLQKNGRTA